MPQRNIVKQNFLQHYILRKDVIRKGKLWLKRHLRKTLKDDLSDIRRIFTLCQTEPAAIIDAGANIGHVTKLFLQQFPQAHIYCFEPDPRPLAMLRENYQADPRVSISNAALSDTEGSFTFNISRMSGSSSLLKPQSADLDYAAASLWQTIEVQTVMLTQFCRDNAIETVDILKLDIEGAELNALKGVSDLLGQGSIRLIHTEFRLLRLAEGQPLLHDIAAYLYQYDYRLFNLYDIAETPYGQGMYGNAIFIAPSLRRVLENITLYR